MKVIFFTNIAAPYRIALFNDLEIIRQGSEFDFEVYFMRISEEDRNWDVNLKDLNFKYKIGKGFYAFIRGFHLYFNPILIHRAITSGNEIILGASWNNINTMLIVLLKKLRLASNTLSVWSEANYLTLGSQKKNKFKNLIRKWFFSGIDGFFIVPGIMSVLSFENWKIKVNSVIFLPNLVSQKIFNYKIKPYLIKDSGKPIFLIVARLEERLKGILNFMQSISIENLKQIELRIAGEGSSLIQYEQFVLKNGLTENVKFLGNLSQNEVSNEYKQADIFVLPSFSDPSPLTIIEAIRSGLPLLLSDRCGNHYEAVKQGENGYTFNPFEPYDIKSKFEMLLEQKHSWKLFSERSLQIADLNFNNEKVLKNLINKFIQNTSH
ncbi:MAG TPA: glycosyltransferase family 4 protein [Hanamia sp.]